MKKIMVLSAIALGIICIDIITEEQSSYHPEFGEGKTSVSFGISTAYAYPPGVGILTNSPNCLSCHANNGPWQDDVNTIIDILDKDTKRSLMQPDGTFLLEVKRWEQKTVLTVIGSKKTNSVPAPTKNAWIYIDPTTIGTNSLSKFAPNWDVNLPMSCRIVGDDLPGYENSDITSLPMTIQPLSNAKNAEIILQVMLTSGETMKNNAHEGLMGSYFERKVKLTIQ